MKLLATFLLLPLSIAVGILVLMFGWGMQPVSWTWIIGGAVFQFVVLVIASALRE
jgi:hypothetical protein